MPNRHIQIVPRVLLVVACALACARAARGQSACVSDPDVKAMLARMDSQAGARADDALRERLLKLKEAAKESFNKTIEAGGDVPAMAQRLRPAKSENTEQLCSILKEFGWPSAAQVGRDGVAAALYLLKNCSSPQLQKALLPVVVAAVKKGDVGRPEFADFFDELRLAGGLKQLFGTQATIRDGFLVLYPIEDEASVDERRRQYGMAPLREYIRALERTYLLPLVKSPGTLTKSFAETPGVARARTSGGPSKDPNAAGDDVISVDANVVSLDVGVYSNAPRASVATLAQKDFAVYEDGREQNVTFFAAADAPFDLVLLIDMSGSTSTKRDLIRKSTRRFIEAARPSDRLAIVTFTDTTNVVAPLTADRKTLLDSVKRIDGDGFTHLWDALKFTLDQVFGPNTAGRRRAVVMMTDGVDNELLSFNGPGSKIEFADLVEAVRQSDALIVPIYLDTESDTFVARRVYKSARDTLKMLADESGGLYYKARNFKDLSGVYEQVVEDLGKVYSIGYRPTNDKRDGLWREVRVQIRDHPELVARARRGYYAK